MSGKKPPSYHDLHITTPKLARTSIFNMPFRVEVSCTRVGGWQIWAKGGDGLPDELLGAEYDYDSPLILDVAGHVIVDSMTTAAQDKANAEMEES